MSIAIPTKIEKCKGAMIATAIGDALGWPNEIRAKNTEKTSKISDHFIEWTRRCGRPYWHNEKILPGEYSDDTQITLSVARSIIAGNWEEILVKKELPYWLNYERGGGRALLKAAESCKKGIVPWLSNYPKDYFNAGGNGVVMRILPHVIASGHSADVNELMINVIKDAIITHGHPRAILGATCYAFALNYLLKKDTVLEYGELVTAVLDGQKIWGGLPNAFALEKWYNVANNCSGYDYSVEWKSTLSNMISQFKFILTSLKKGLIMDDSTILTQLECFGKVNGAGDVAILTAVYLSSKYATNPVLGIKIPAFLFGADTDTIASITGGLLGMLCGANWIPTEWKKVQDYECLIQITELLLSENSKEAAKVVVSGVKEKTGDWKSSPIGLMRSLNTSNIIESGKSAIVIINKWQTSLGQTIYLKDYQKNRYSHLQTEKQMQLFEQSSMYDTIGYRSTDQVQTDSHISVQKAIITQEHQKQFVLGLQDICVLLDEPILKRITFRKVLQIIDDLITSNKSSAVMAKQMDVNQDAIDIIRAYVKNRQ